MKKNIAYIKLNEFHYLIDMKQKISQLTWMLKLNYTGTVSTKLYCLPLVLYLRPQNQFEHKIE